MLLELLNRALAAEAMTTLEFYCCKLTLGDGLTLSNDLISVADFAKWGLHVNHGLLFDILFCDSGSCFLNGKLE